MSRSIICTVGTSLLTNRDDRPWEGWNPRKPDPLPGAEEVDRWLKEADPETASAETNTLSRLDLSEADTITFLHSDTAEGRFCAERLKAFYSPRVRSVELRKVGKLGYGAHHFSAGLKALVDIVIRCVHEAMKQGRQSLFCATGGFKAEIAFMNLMGALLGIEVVYVHELHRELVRLPRLPLTWDAAFVEQHEKFFRWIDEEPRKSSEVESWLKSRPELRPLVESADDGCAYLSPAGDLLYKVAKERLVMGPRATWPNADLKPPGDKDRISGIEHHRPAGWENFVNRLCSIDCVSSVRYDATGCSGQRVKVRDPERGLIEVCYERSGKKLPLLVETTARGEEQCELVANYIRNLL